MCSSIRSVMSSSGSKILELAGLYSSSYQSCALNTISLGRPGLFRGLLGVVNQELRHCQLGFQAPSKEACFLCLSVVGFFLLLSLFLSFFSWQEKLCRYSTWTKRDTDHMVQLPMKWQSTNSEVNRGKKKKKEKKKEKSGTYTDLLN